MNDAPHVSHDPAGARFQIEADGYVAELVYRRHGQRLVLLHTGVPAELEGRGLGASLVRAAVAQAAQEGLTIVPLCPFARAWLARHPGEAGQVPIDWGDEGAPAPT